jgi:hypothetical protein
MSFLVFAGVELFVTPKRQLLPPALEGRTGQYPDRTHAAGCWNHLSLACQGSPRDDGQTFRYEAQLIAGLRARIR